MSVKISLNVKNVSSDMCSSRICAPSEDSGQTAHTRSLIWVFARRFSDSQGCKVSSCGERICKLIWVFVRHSCQKVRFHGYGSYPSWNIVSLWNCLLFPFKDTLNQNHIYLHTKKVIFFFSKYLFSSSFANLLETLIFYLFNILEIKRNIKLTV